MDAGFQATDDFRCRARSIQAAIRRIAEAEPVVVGFPSPSLIADAFAALKGLGLRKPLFASRKEWTRKAIVFEPKAYELLWPHVELEFVVDGSLRVFSGLGAPRRDNPLLAAIETRLPPIYWDIRLEERYPAFEQLFAEAAG